MGPSIHYPPVFHYHNFVRIGQRRYPVGHDNAGTPLEVGSDGADYRVFGFHIHGGKTIVDHDYRPFQNERPCYRNSLPLATGKFYSSFPYSRIIPLWHGCNLVMNGGGSGNFFDLHGGGIRLTESDIEGYGIRK